MTPPQRVVKHQAGWTIIRKDGATTWRSPTGRTYTRTVDPYLDPAEHDPPEHDPPPF